MARKNPVMILEGADQLSAALKELGDRVTGLLLKQAAEEGAEVIAEEARRLAPRETGALAGGIAVQPGRLQQGRAQYNISYAGDEFYGGFVELGTAHTSAQPFLRPAFDTKGEEATEKVGEVLRESLKDVLS